MKLKIKNIFLNHQHDTFTCLLLFYKKNEIQKALKHFQSKLHINPSHKKARKCVNILSTIKKEKSKYLNGFKLAKGLLSVPAAFLPQIF